MSTCQCICGLYVILARTPTNGVQQLVHCLPWSSPQKGTKVNLNCGYAQYEAQKEYSQTISWLLVAYHIALLGWLKKEEEDQRRRRRRSMEKKKIKEEVVVEEEEDNDDEQF